MIFLFIFEKTKMESIVIFDFDDTLFPTTYLANYDYNLNAFDKTLEGFLFDFLSEVIETKSQVYIITNAKSGWIEYCFFNFLPKLEQLKQFIKVISAPDLVAKINDPQIDLLLHSKTIVFNSIVLDLDRTKKYQLISIGDGIPEVKAISYISKNFENIQTKMVRFIERPSHLDVLNQLKLVQQFWNDLFQYNGNLELVTSSNFSEKQLKEQEEELFRSLQ